MTAVEGGWTRMMLVVGGGEGWKRKRREERKGNEGKGKEKVDGEEWMASRVSDVGKG